MKDEKGYRLVRDDAVNKFDIIQLPIFGFAQCGNQGKAVINEYTQERLPVTMAFLGTSDVANCFFVRAKGNSMEPKIQDGDLILIRQQPQYDENDFVFVVHNQLPKLKKIIKQEDGSYRLESVNRFFDTVEIDPYDETKIVGVVKKIIKNHIQIHCNSPVLNIIQIQSCFFLKWQMISAKYLCISGDSGFDT